MACSSQQMNVHRRSIAQTGIVVIGRDQRVESLAFGDKAEKAPIKSRTCAARRVGADIRTRTARVAPAVTGERVATATLPSTVISTTKHSTTTLEHLYQSLT